MFADINTVYANKDKHLADSILIELRKNKVLESSQLPDLYNKGIEHAKKSGDIGILGDYYFSLGRFYHEIGGYPISYKNFLAALNIYERQKNKKKIAQTYKIMGESNRATSNYFLALEYLDKAIILFNKFDDTTGILSSYNRKAAIYYELKIMDSVLHYTKLSNKLAYKLGNEEIVIANNYNIIGAYYKDVNQDSALKYFGKALDILNDTMFYDDKSNVLINISIMYFDGKNYPKARDYALEAYKIGSKRGILQYIIGSSRILAATYKNIGDFKNAYFYQNIYTLARDSINDTKKSLQIYELQNKLEKEKLQQGIKYQEDINFYKIVGLIILSIIFLLFTLILYLRKNELKRKNVVLEHQNKVINNQAEELAIMNNNKDLLFSIVAHDLKNPLSTMQMIARMFVDEYNHLSDNEKVEFINDIIKASISANLLLESLLVWSRSQRNLIEVTLLIANPYEMIENICGIIRADLIRKKIEFINNIPKNYIFVTDINMFSTIFKNLITNAVKFSYQSGKIEVGMIENPINKEIEFFVSDTGIGMTPEEMDNLFKPGKRNMTLGTDNEQGTGLGLLICKDFCKKLNGKILVESQKDVGSKFKVIFQPQKI